MPVFVGRGWLHKASATRVLAKRNRNRGACKKQAEPKCLQRASGTRVLAKTNGTKLLEKTKRDELYKLNHEGSANRLRGALCSCVAQWLRP